MKKILIVCVAFALLFQNIGLAQRNYLQKAYSSAGGEAILSEIEQWRIEEKSAILSGVAGLPTSAKEELVRSADQFLAQPWPFIRLTDYIEYRQNGNRVNFENLYLNRRAKLSALCVAELVNKKGKYLPEIANGIWMILEESTWVLPAHHYTGKKTADPDPDFPTIDLFAAETAAHLAWMKLLLSKELTAISPVLVSRMSEELDKRIMKPYLATDSYWWMGLNNERKQNNWNIWINSNVLKVAALSEDKPKRRAELIGKVIRSADRFIEDYPKDGGCDEGPAYWSAAGGCLGEFLNVLSRISSAKIAWKDEGLFKNIGDYIYKVHVDGSRFVNFADAPGAIVPDVARVYNFWQLFGSSEMKSFASYLTSLYGNKSSYLNNGSFLSFVSNVRIYKDLSATSPLAPLPMRSWLPDLEIVNLRIKKGNNSGLNFMAKAGNNGESHNHNDVGNFMLYCNGDPVLIDVGKGTYTKQTFGPDRYKLWYNQSAWHNCPVINGADQKDGARYKASDVQFTKGNDTEVFSMDLGRVYPESARIKSWTREFVFNRKIGELHLKENYKLFEFVKSSDLSFITCKRPEVTKEGAVRLISFSGKSTITMEYDRELFMAQVEEQTVSDGAIAGVWGNVVYRLTLKGKSHATKGKHVIKFKIS